MNTYDEFQKSSMSVRIDPVNDTVTLVTSAGPEEELIQTFPREAVKQLIGELRVAISILEGRHPVVTKPGNLRELVAYLELHPDVMITNLKGDKTSEHYESHDEGGLFFSGGAKTFLPVNCRMGAAAAHEAGVTFDDAGFTLTKFGHSIRVEYR